MLMAVMELGVSNVRVVEKQLIRLVIRSIEYGERRKEDEIGLGRGQSKGAALNIQCNRKQLRCQIGETNQ